MSFEKFANIDEHCSKDTQLKREDVSKLEEWQIMQLHLPSPLHTMETVLFLHKSSYSMEATKQRIDAFYTFRTHHRDLFNNLDPLGAELQLGMNTFVIASLPELTPEGCMVMYGHIRDGNPSAFNFNTMLKMIDMITHLSLMQRDYPKEIVGIINVEAITLPHLLKWNAFNLKTFGTYIHRIAPIRFTTLHFVNCVPFMDKIMAFLKPLFGKGFNKKMFLHYGDNATIFEIVPKNMLPIECGGDSFCAEEYFKNVTRKDMEYHSEYFKKLEGQLVDEKKRSVKPAFDLHFFGVEGTFKKLDID